MSARVAVLMAVRNDYGALLWDALESLAQQTYQDFEVLLADDGSADAGAATEHAVMAFRERMAIVYNYHRPFGLPCSLNRLADTTSSRYLARLDADDTWVPDKLERQVRFMDAHPEVVLLGGCWQLPGGQICGPPHVADAGLRAALHRRNPFAHSTVLMRRDAFERVGGYDESFPVAQDWDLWVRLSRVGRLAALPDVLATLGQSARQVTRRRPWARRWHGMRVRWRARDL